MRYVCILLVKFILYLNDSSSANVIHDTFVDTRLVDKAGKGVSLEVMGHQVLVISS